VKSWLNVSGETSRSSGAISCVRTISASMPPAPKNASEVKKKSRPIRL
jgi:hypothetical protein